MSSEPFVLEVPAAAGVPRLGVADPPPAAADAGPKPLPALEPLELARPDEVAVWWARGDEEPVFLDRTGRRGPAVRLMALVAAAAAALWLGAVVTGSLGFGSLPGVSATAPPPPIGAPPRILARALPPAHRHLALDVDRPRSRRAATHPPRVIRV